MSLLEGSRANLSPLQEKEKEQMMIATSGMKLLELYPRQNANGLLAKMLKALLTSKTAWCSDRSTMIWKKKVSKCKVLLFQLAVSVRGIKGKEYGLLPTPTQDSVSERTKKYKQGGTPLTMAVRQMFPTPTVGCEEGGEQSSRVERTKSGGFILRKKNKPKMTFGAKLSDAMLYLEKQKLYPTPKARDYQGAEPNRIVETKTGWSKERKKSKVRYGASLNDVVEYQKPGGKLNPNFVEFLMAYPTNWTKIDKTELKHSETQSFHKSQEKSEKL